MFLVVKRCFSKNIWYELGGFRREYMGYYCNECKKTISAEEFFHSMNRYHKALCRDHQRSTSISGTTKDLQDLVRDRHKDELIKEIPVLKTVKDWIEADFEIWEKVLKNKDEGSYSITVTGEEVKDRDQKRVKK
jgi:hypothetical protein